MNEHELVSGAVCDAGPLTATGHTFRRTESVKRQYRKTTLFCFWGAQTVVHSELLENHVKYHTPPPNLCLMA